MKQIWCKNLYLCEGRPAYDPKSLYKLVYLWKQKRNSFFTQTGRKLQGEFGVKWMLGGVEPDFRTISDFRKSNIDSLKEIFHELNRRLSGAVEWGFCSVDGSKDSSQQLER
ncbi:MAG: transposase [Blautia wexlerae]